MAVPSFTPHAFIARIIPLVFEFTARLMTFCFSSSKVEFIKSENSFSNSSVTFPVVSQPERMTSITAFSSSSEIEGFENGTFKIFSALITSPRCFLTQE